MATVLIRLEGPMQSWGLAGRGPNSAHRTTQDRPTKSAVIGLVANAMGYDWSDDITDLAALRFGVRADRPGYLESDYHTTGSGDFPMLPGNIYSHPAWARKAKTYTPGRPFDAPYLAPADISRDPNGTLTAKPGLPVLTRDWYLADASFLAALSGTPDLTARIAAALAAPARTLYLGRRAYPPAEPVLAGHTDTAMLEALTTTPAAPRCAPGPLDAWLEPDFTIAGADVVHDQPISYSGPATRGARLEQHTRIHIDTTTRADFYNPDPTLNPEPTA
jgi:CRISPR system Cascade subunit CasD